MYIDSETCDIKSEILEKLLQALDGRHVSGWYHPAMRFQAETCTLQGVNDELRTQLKETRYWILNHTILLSLVLIMLQSSIKNKFMLLKMSIKLV